MPLEDTIAQPTTDDSVRETPSCASSEAGSFAGGPIQVAPSGLRSCTAGRSKSHWGRCLRLEQSIGRTIN